MQQIQFPHRLGFKKIFTPQILLQACCSCNMTNWASTLFSTCLRRTFCLHHADSDANTCNKYNFLTGLGSRKIFTPQILSKHAAHATWQFGHLPSSVHASEEPFVCTMQIQTLIHATNTISSQAWVQEKSSHHRFCSKQSVHATWQIGHLPSSVHASEEPFVCIMQIQMLMHATVLSRHWQQVFGLWRNSTDPKTKGWIPTRTKQELGKWSTTSSN